MIKNWIVILTICLLSIPSFSQVKTDDRGYIVKVGDMAPDFDMELTDGSKIKLSDLRGNLVMLQFTASWCSVCRKEMPHIESEIWQVYKDKGLKLFGVDRDEPVDKALELKKGTKVTYDIGLDPGADIFGLYADKEAGVTRNVLIDKDGKIIFLTRLYNIDEFKNLVARIAKEME